jgi:hypothetical protein
MMQMAPTWWRARSIAGSVSSNGPQEYRHKMRETYKL